MECKRSRAGFLARVAVGCLLIGAGGGALEAGCISADLPGPVRLPGTAGSFDGRVRLCNVRTLSPVASIYRLEVEGGPACLLVTRHTPNEAARDQQPVLVFHRDELGRLNLAAFAAPEGSRIASHVLVPPRVRRSATGIALRAPRPSTGEDGEMLLVSARPASDSR